MFIFNGFRCHNHITVGFTFTLLPLTRCKFVTWCTPCKLCCIAAVSFIGWRKPNTRRKPQCHWQNKTEQYWKWSQTLITQAFLYILFAKVSCMMLNATFSNVSVITL